MPEAYDFGVFHLDAEEHRLLREGSPVPLPPKAFDLLLDLVRHAGHLREKKALMDLLWPETFVEEGNLTYTVSALRKSLGDGRDDPRYVETVATKGYRFVAPVRHRNGIAEASSPAAAGPAAPRRSRGLYAAVGAGALLIAAAILGWRVAAGPSRDVQPPVVHVELGVAPATELDGGGNSGPSPLTRGGSCTSLAWLADGSGLVFVGREKDVRRLYVRSLLRPEARPIPGTEGAAVLAVAPDGRSVVFWANGEIKRAPLDGSPVQTIARVGWRPVGMAVGGTGRVAFPGSDGRIWQVEAGGALRAISHLVAPELRHALPQWLPGDEVLIYTARSTSETWGEERVVAERVATGKRQILARDACDARVLFPGHLLFMRRGQLMAIAFDPGRLEVKGEPAVVVDQVAQALHGDDSGDATGAGQFAVSSTGALAYIPSPVVLKPDSQLVSVDRHGRITPLPIERRRFQPGVSLSPDGTRLTVEVIELTEQALWVADLQRGTLTKVTRGGEVHWESWTPDGMRIAFGWVQGGTARLAWTAADGSQAPETLMPGYAVPSSWSPDGHMLAATDGDDLWMVEVRGGRAKGSQRMRTTECEQSPAFSPDGRWLAYDSYATGRWEVYVRPFPGPGAAAMVSTSRGRNPTWNHRSDELFFVRCDSSSSTRCQMFAVPVHAGHAGAPSVLFEYDDNDLQLGSCYPARCYDVSPDGQRFYGVKTVPRDPLPAVTHVNLVLNWISDLEAQVPADSQ